MVWKRADGEAGSSLCRKQGRRVKKESQTYFLSYAGTVSLHSPLHGLVIHTFSHNLQSTVTKDGY